MNKKLIVVSLACIGLGFTAYNSYAASSSTSSQSEMTSQGMPADNWVQLGKGVYSPSGLPATSVCMKDATTPTFTNGSGHLSLSSEVSQSQLQQYFSLSVSGKGGWGGFSASASANFATSSQDDSYSRNFNYVQDFGWKASFNPAGFGSDNLTSAAQAAYKAGVPQFLGFCGDSYVSNAMAGALLAVNVKLQFKSHQDQESFNSEMGASQMGMGSLTVAISQSRFSKTSNAAITVTAMQLGGMPDKLADIFKKDPTGGFYVASCDFSSLANCTQVINGIIAYAQALSTQVRDPAGTIIPNNLAYYNPSTTNYSDIGIDLTTPIPSPAVVAAQAQLQELYRNTRADLTFVKHYQSSAISSHFDLSMTDFLKTAQNALNFRMSFLNAHGFDCYTAKDSSTCKNIMDNMNSTFATVPQYQVVQGPLEYVKQGWVSKESNGGTGYWYPIGVTNNRYYYNWNNNSAVDIATLLFSNNSLDLTVKLDVLPFSSVLNRTSDNPKTYDGLVSNSSKIKLSKIENPA